ncbi:hypothetical protein Hte_011994 [Hypoxylon texense]
MADRKSLSMKDVELQKDNASVSMAHPTELVDPQVAKSLKRKADFILLPILTVAYLCNSLDRSNVSNANTAGLESDLGLVGTQFNQVLTYYQIPFIVLGPVTTVFTKLVGAKYALFIMLFVFGIASLATGFARTFEHLVVCRVFVGAFESGFLASVIYYLSTWYTRAELASRIGIFYGSLVASSAFGGLLAYGMFHVTPGDGYFAWSYLFFLEGGLTILWSFVCLFLIPSDPKSAWFLSNAEKEAAELRLRENVQSVETKFNLREGFMEFRTAHGYIRVLMIFISGVMLTSNANFLAMIVKRLGFSTVKTNLYTVAPALTGAVFLVAWCKSSDYFRERGFHVAMSILVSLVGYVILFTVDTSDTAVLYFAMFLCTIGAYPSTPIGSAWTVSNIPNLNARAFTSGVYIAAGNCAGLLSSNIYLTREAPRYITSLRVNVAMCVVGALINVGYSLWMRWENRRRDRVYGPVGVSVEGIESTRDPRFRFQY